MLKAQPALPDAALTPMMAQYFEIRSANPGYLLFYRMGDFYELFFDDAEIASAALGIVLTKRGKHLGEDIAMCGVPIHAAQDYLKKLIALGHRVAICEQVEDPAEAKKRGAKSVVKRDVVRLVTAGTLTEDDLLPQRGANYLVSLARLAHADAEIAVAWADISTGETGLTEIEASGLADLLARLNPSEILLAEGLCQGLTEQRSLPPSMLARITVLGADRFDSEVASALLRETFADGAFDPSAYSRTVRAAVGALFGYIQETQKGAGLVLAAPLREDGDTLLGIDLATRASLELLEAQRGGQAGSLRAAIDLTVTGAGGREFARRLSAPLAEAGAINARLDAVALLVENLALCDALRDGLKGQPDLARAMTRLALGRGGPRDVAAAGRALAGATALARLLAQAENLPAVLKGVADRLSEAPQDLADEIGRALDDLVPVLARDGGFVRAGYDQTLDSERALSRETRDVIAALETRLASETGLKSLRIKHNGVLGYFVELSSVHGPKLMEAGSGFVHRQTMANAMRFTTPELAELEGRIARAGEAALGIELNIFERLAQAIVGLTETLRTVAGALAELDVVAALAHLAGRRNYVRPVIEEGLAFEIVGGRHPVVEAMVAEARRTFVANDCDLSGSPETGGGALWIVTGPNMGGKSTYLRQNALIAVMAQMGGYVPAERAQIGVVDRVFSRVGASDDIAHGRSTFMVEMVETATILARASMRSLVVLDEIGRGTATFDGLAIAWATLEHLNRRVGCRALFATHFHELTGLSARLDRVANVTMKVREWQGDVVFLHEVGKGAADRSYGIQVAKLAGLPGEVVTRARQVLERLEKGAAGRPSSAPLAGVLDELPLFAHAPAEPVVSDAPDPVGELLDTIRPDETSPREALELIYRLKSLRNDARRH